MATLDTTPVRELSDNELRKRLLSLGYDVPVSVNREFLVRKLENASAGGNGRTSNKRHSMAASPNPTTSASNSSPARKRKSLAATPTPTNRGHGHQNNVSTPMSPLAASSPMQPGTPQHQYMGSPASTISIATPTTPSPFVSRLSTPSPGSSPRMNNGEAGSHSPRFSDYYNYFKNSSPTAGDGGGGTNYGYSYNRGRMSSPGSFNPVTSVAPPSRSERNGYSTNASGGSTSLGVESDWCGGHFVSKVLLCLFVLFFLVIGVLYLSKNTVDPRGLTSDISKSSSEKDDTVPREPQQQQQPPPTPSPAKKKVEAPPPLTSMVYPVCGLKGVDPEACIPKEVVKISRTLFNALKDELTQRARKIGCRSDFKETVTLKDAKALLYTLTELRKGDVDSAFQGMLLLVTENPRGGLTLHGGPEQSEISSKDVQSLDLAVVKISATGINPDFICGVQAAFFSMALYVTFAAGLSGTGYLAWKGYKFYKSKKESEQDEIFKMVERVLELLSTQHELSENSQVTPFLAVNHIRDELLPPNERLRKEAFWNKVVNYISNHESRVREEVQHISGEEFKVWRWLPSASPLVSKRFSTTANSHVRQRSRFSMPGSPMMSPGPAVPSTSAQVASPSHASMSPPQVPQQHNLYPSLSSLDDDDDDAPAGGNGDTRNNKWQGQAFETCEGSPNALPITPTTCLKIRHMFTEKDGAKERARIECVILEKCNQAQILHIGIDTNSVEGCVYIRCKTKDDARSAFNALHGWWFEGKLLSVKFLREERYFSRFPEARNKEVPMRLPR